MRHCGEETDPSDISNGHKRYSHSQYPLQGKLLCPCCGSVLYQRLIPVQAKRSTAWCCEQGENACRRFILRSSLVESALLRAYRAVTDQALQEQLREPAFEAAARAALAIRQEHPSFARVDYWWVEDLIDHIEFGLHLAPPSDHSMTVCWLSGLRTTVPSGVSCKRDQPSHVADLYAAYLKRRDENQYGERQP